MPFNVQGTDQSCPTRRFLKQEDEPYTARYGKYCSEAVICVKMLGTKDCGIEDTNNGGFHITDKLLAVGLGVDVGVELVLDPALAVIAAAMLLEAAAEDSATKACEKLAVP